MVQFDGRRRVVRMPHQAHWLWHVKAQPTHHFSTPDVAVGLRRLEALHLQHRSPARTVSNAAHPLAWLEAAYGLQAYISVVEGR